MSYFTYKSLNKFLCYKEIFINISFRRSVSLSTLKFLNFRDLANKETEEAGTIQSKTIFNAVENANKNVLKHDGEFKKFKLAIQLYIEKEGVNRRGHVEFIYQALNKMKQYKVEKNIDAYKELMKVFPKGVMVPLSVWQAAGKHYPKQQDCAVHLLDYMEYNGVMPDDDFCTLIDDRFGDRSCPMRKYRRMMYWLPKMRSANPYPIPRPLPADPAELSGIALKRMSVDIETCVSIYRSEAEGDADRGFIVSAQSPKQRELIERHPAGSPLYIEGAFNVWTQNVMHKYFILSSDTRPPSEPSEKDQDEMDLSGFTKMFDDEENSKEVMMARCVHEQEDRTVLAMAITESMSKDSLISWTRLLQESNPRLKHLVVLFQLQTSLTPDEQTSPMSGDQNLTHA